MQNIKARRSEDPGIGTNFDRPVDRLVGRDDQFTVRRVGASTGVREAFVSLVSMSTGRFLGVLALGYLIINLLFGAFFMAVGVEGIGNARLETLVDRWATAVEMSVQTITTVGYGSLYPDSPGTWLVAGVEGMFGILSFSLIAAVMYARFARPNARLAYSEKALIAPFRDGWSFQMRLANRRSTLLMEVEARLMLVMADVDEHGERLNYYNLPLQLEKVNFLPLSWTLVHPINAESPLAGISFNELVERRAEVIVIIKGVDEGYMQHVYTRHSYRYDEMVWGGRYVRAFSATKQGTMQLDLDKLSDHQRVDAPERTPHGSGVLA
jgi:inward rectifier potassium channel